ncbi:MAG: hypothetical protein ABEK17_01315 [Candidatus Aenigmatarchaeota archaeon]
MENREYFGGDSFENVFINYSNSTKGIDPEDSKDQVGILGKRMDTLNRFCSLEGVQGNGE